MKCGIAYPVVRPHIPRKILRPFATVERKWAVPAAKPNMESANT